MAFAPTQFENIPKCCLKHATNVQEFSYWKKKQSWPLIKNNECYGYMALCCIMHNWFLPLWMSAQSLQIVHCSLIVRDWHQNIIFTVDILEKNPVTCWEQKAPSNNKIDPKMQVALSTAVFKGWIFALRLFHCFTVLQIWHTGASICSVLVFLWWSLATGALPSCRSGLLPTAA